MTDALSNAQRIASWRSENPAAVLTAPVLLEILELYDLSGADLSGADLSGADLGGADLSGADLSGADLSGADLGGADLSGADLGGADLWRPDLGGANLRRADLRRANLRYANLRRANLRYANLRYANLWGADLRRANLPGFVPIKAPSGEGHAVATPEGWQISIGCWTGKAIQDLRTLVTDPEAKWPEAKGEEREKRRPVLKAVLALVEANAEYHSGLVEELAALWKGEEND